MYGFKEFFNYLSINAINEYNRKYDVKSICLLLEDMISSGDIEIIVNYDHENELFDLLGGDSYEFKNFTERNDFSNEE